MVHPGNFKSGGTILTVDRITHHLNVYSKERFHYGVKGRKNAADSRTDRDEVVNSASVAVVCANLNFSVFQSQSVQKFLNKITVYRMTYGEDSYNRLVSMLASRKVITRHAESITSKFKKVSIESKSIKFVFILFFSESRSDYQRPFEAQ